MSITVITDSLKDYAKDLRINMGNVLTEDDSPGLTEKQILCCALSVALAVKSAFLVKQLFSAGKEKGLISEGDLSGIKTAVSLMGMNNVYYRTLHLAEDPALSEKPARLRMTMMRGHGLDQRDFEIYSLSVSALFGCGMCVKSHIAKLKQEGLSLDGIQSVIRITAVVQGVHQSLGLDGE